MCSHYDPLLNASRLQQYFGVESEQLNLKPSLWPGYFGPFVRKHEFLDVGDEAVPTKELLVGSFGLIPFWSKDDKIARRTYNARSETVHEKPSFRDSWKQRNFCIIPAEAIFEPDWRSGKAIPTRIVRTDNKPLGIAGIWTSWRNPEGGEVVKSFSMLTVNADDHPFMKEYHKPQDEKRMVVILQEDEYDNWINASLEDSRYFLKQFPSELMKVDSQGETTKSVLSNTDNNLLW